MAEEFIPIIFFVICAVIVKMSLDYKSRNRLIEKGLVDEKMKRYFSAQTEMGLLSNLKWGLILIGVGVAFLLYEWVDLDLSGEGLFGLLLLLAGLGFILYYPIAQKRLKEIERKIDDQTPPQ